MLVMFFFQCMILHQELTSVKQELQTYKQQCLTKDQTISNLSQEVQDLKAKLLECNSASQSKDNFKLTLQSNVKIVVEDQKSSGNGYNFSLPFDHPENRTITAKVQQDFKDADGDNLMYSRPEITGACHTYFNNKKRDENRKDKGKHRGQSRRGKQKRIKLQERKDALASIGQNMSDERKAMAHELLYNPTMGMKAVSSEEDAGASSDEDVPDRRRIRRIRSKKVRNTILLPWESIHTSRIKTELDQYHRDNLISEHSRKRKWTVIKDSTCPVSYRQRPKDAPDWL